MTHGEFLNWKKFIEKELINERDERALQQWYFAHLCYYIHDLNYILGGKNPTTVKNFFLELEEKEVEKQKSVPADNPLIDEDILKDKLECEKAFVGLMLGMNYADIKRKHGMKK